MKITDKYIDVLTGGEWWDCIPDDFSDWERWLLERERAMKEMAGIASRLTFCGECVYFNRITDTLGTCERCAEGTKTEDDFCSNGDAGEGEE